MTVDSGNRALATRVENTFLRSISLKAPPDVVRFQNGAFGKSAIWALTHNMDSILVAQFTAAANVGLYRGARQIIDTTRYPFSR